MFKVTCGGRVGNILSIPYEIIITKHVPILVHFSNNKYVVILLSF